MSAVVAILTDPETGSPVAVRFPSSDDLYKWENKHPEVFVESMIPLVSRAKCEG